jgi:hypothetical protein
MPAEIHIPAGSNVLAVPSVIGFHTDTLTGHAESELIFPPSSIFQMSQDTGRTVRWVNDQGETVHAHPIVMSCLSVQQD